MLSELPFCNLTDKEFYEETGAWIYNPVNSLLNECRYLFKDIIESPDKVNDCYENLASDFLESKYLTIKQSGSISFRILSIKATRYCIVISVVYRKI
jgi:hypothetical protein